MLYQLSYGGDACFCGQYTNGAEGSRTPDLSVANAALSQLSYGPGYADYGRTDAELQWARQDSNL